MNVFDQYGIKEVADVTIYSIHKKEDGSNDVYYVPALYLDTLKVSTIEKTADNTWAQGGLGNSRFISWDSNKAINLTLEDALCTPASLGLCWGGILSADWKNGRVEHKTGVVENDCGTERISRMEKAFYPRNDTVNGTISRLLPRDGKEDMLVDGSGDPVYLDRSSILDGTDVRGFGSVDGHPYKWKLEIETAVKSVAIVPDRFFSTYGKSYPIKRRQTVGINQPSEAFKYEIIYLRGYDQYNDDPPTAKIIYHKQMEWREITQTCADDDAALNLLDNFVDYPYLKLRVCWDGSVRGYLGSANVDWNLERQIENSSAAADTEWIEIPQINTDQFRGLDLWLRFDSINALSYYLITKYENNIFNIAPKTINSTMPETTKLENVDYSAKTNLKNYIDGLTSSDIVFGRSYSVDAFVSTTTEAHYQILEELVSLVRTSFDIDEEDSVSAVRVKISESKKMTLYYSLPARYVGLDYSLEDASMGDSAACTPCCKKDNLSRAIWAYVNPKNMQPYDDDYWFHYNEPYYKKSLTLSTKNKPLKAKKIIIEQGTFPGMYMIEMNTYIRARDTGEDERVQIKLPLCKVRSEHTITLEADGDATTFNLDVEVATPVNGIPAEITFYEVEKEMTNSCSGKRVPKDGSTKIL